MSKTDVEKLPLDDLLPFHFVHDSLVVLEQHRRGPEGFSIHQILRKMIHEIPSFRGVNPPSPQIIEHQLVRNENVGLAGFKESRQVDVEMLRRSQDFPKRSRPQVGFHDSGLLELVRDLFPGRQLQCYRLQIQVVQTCIAARYSSSRQEQTTVTLGMSRH